MPRKSSTRANVPAGARYENECLDCVFLEQHESDDPYYCKIYKQRGTGHARSFFAPMLVVIEPDGSEFACPVANAQEIGERNPRIARALLIAREKGFVSGDPMTHHLVAMADEHRVEPNALKSVLDEIGNGDQAHR
jgi:hypothetical protein